MQHRGKDLDLDKGGKDISMHEITATDAIKKESTAQLTKRSAKVQKRQGQRSRVRASKKRTPSAKTSERAANCQELTKVFAAPYKALFSRLPQTQRPAKATYAVRLAQAQMQNCQKKSTRKQALKTILSALSTHSGRVGLILPISNNKASLSNHITEGMRAALAEENVPFNHKVVLLDSGSNVQQTEAALAQLTFREQVTTIIGGLDDGVAEALIKWADRLAMPTLILSRSREIVRDSRFAFRVYPDERRLALTLAHATSSRGLRKVAILRPTSRKSDHLIEYYKAAIAASGGHVTQEIMYTSDNFNSMEAAVRNLLKIDITARRDEYRQAYEKERRRAKALGVKFNPRMVSLDPLIDFDGIFLPDDFRAVRHFAKLLKYHGANNTTMIGNHEWRSAALIKPFDEYLTGAFFADFIGAYSALPRSVSAPTVSSPFFVGPTDVVPVDFRLIGYRAGRLGALTIQNPGIKRHNIANALKRARSDSTTFFGNGPIFDDDRNSNWPTYVFTVKNKRLRLQPGQIDKNIEKQISKHARVAVEAILYPGQGREKIKVRWSVAVQHHSACRQNRKKEPVAPRKDPKEGFKKGNRKGAQRGVTKGR